MEDKRDISNLYFVVIFMLLVAYWAAIKPFKTVQAEIKPTHAAFAVGHVLAHTASSH